MTPTTVSPAVIALRNKALLVLQSAPKGSRQYRRAMAVLQAFEEFCGPEFVGR
jgi:hypothetical protein